MAVTERDRLIIKTINRFGYATSLSVQQLLGISRTACYRRLKKMVEQGFLKHSRILADMSGAYWVTGEGVGLCESQLGAGKKPSPATFEHDLMVIDLWVYLREEMKSQGKTANWITAREIKSAQMAAVRSEDQKRVFAVLGSKTPDGILEVDGVKIAIELEVTLKSRARLKRILNDYSLRLINGEYASVAYYCAKPSILRVVSEEVQNLSTVERFQVLELPEALKYKKGGSLCRTL